MKSAVEIEFVYLFVRFEDSLDGSVSKVIDGGETYFSTESEKKWDLVDKEYVRGHGHVAMKFEKVGWYLDKIPCHMSGFDACGLSFESCNVLTPYLVGSDEVFDRHWAVLNLVALEYPFEIFNRRVSKGGIQSPCLLCAFDLSLGKTHLLSEMVLMLNVKSTSVGSKSGVRSCAF